MKKAGFLFIISLITTVSLFAEGISSKQARTVATNFWLSRVLKTSVASQASPEISAVIPFAYQNQVVYYQVNMQPEGWILVSATNAAIPILAYSPTGKFDTQDMPVNAAAWLLQYQKKLIEVIHLELPQDEQTSEKWDQLLSTNIQSSPQAVLANNVEPLLTTTWNQSRYYNDMCPADPSGPGGHCYAGCVPTTMGQICNYFRWPETGLGAYTYEEPTYGTLTADFGNTTYRWDEMAVSLNSTNLAVAELLYHLGVSCDLVYGPDGSGMYNHKAAYSLRTFFKYDPATQYVYRDSTNLNWDSLIINHIDRRIPVYYAGWSVPNINGHAFVCDGYQTDHFFHFNWGWGGSSDGYFYTDALNPGGSNFNLAQELIINAVPDSSLYNYPTGCSGFAELNTTNGTINDGSGPLFDYLPETSCNWLIAPQDSVSSITLRFLEFSLTGDDTLYVYNGDSQEAALIASYTGALLPGDLTVNGDHVFINFIVHSDTGSTGWLIGYQSEIPVYCTANEQLTAISGTLSDGSGGRDYHNTSSCMWMIAPAGAQLIELQFDTFDTEAAADVVTVYDGNTVIGEFSGNELPPLLTATSGYMFLIFSTNFEVTAPGWSATYTTDLVDVDENETIPTLLTACPNPATDLLTLNYYGEKGESVFELINCLGVSVFSQISLTNQVSFNVGGLAPGLYLARVSSEKDIQQIKILIK